MLVLARERRLPRRRETAGRAYQSMSRVCTGHAATGTWGPSPVGQQHCDCGRIVENRASAARQSPLETRVPAHSAQQAHQCFCARLLRSIFRYGGPHSSRHQASKRGRGPCGGRASHSVWHSAQRPRERESVLFAKETRSLWRCCLACVQFVKRLLDSSVDMRSLVSRVCTVLADGCTELVESSFRGRELVGARYALPAGYVGWVMVRPQAGREPEPRAQASGGGRMRDDDEDDDDDGDEDSDGDADAGAGAGNGRATAADGQQASKNGDEEAHPVLPEGAAPGSWLVSRLFDGLTFWNHTRLPSADDTFAKALGWLELAPLLHGTEAWPTAVRRAAPVDLASAGAERKVSRSETAALSAADLASAKAASDELLAERQLRLAQLDEVAAAAAGARPGKAVISRRAVAVLPAAAAPAVKRDRADSESDEEAACIASMRPAKRRCEAEAHSDGDDGDG